MYLSYQNGKINGYTEEPQDLVLYNLDKVEETTDKYVLDGEQYVKLDEEYYTLKAPEYKKELINNIYQIKADKAYGGVTINDTLVFETNQTSITNTVASLALMSDTATANWKFYTINGEPIFQQVTKLQLAGIAQFGREMMDEAFKVEGEANTALSTATVEQLNNKEWRNNFITEIQTEMDKVNNKLTVEFGQSEV